MITKNPITMEFERIVDSPDKSLLFGTKIKFDNNIEIELTPLQTCQLFSHLLLMIPHLIEIKR